MQAKKVRVENADVGRIKITVEFWEHDAFGEAKFKFLRHLSEPTDMMEIDLPTNCFLLIKGE